MNGLRSRSKKPYAVSSRQPRDTVFFLDRSLGKHVVADALRNAGLAVQVHDDHLPVDAPDVDWIGLVGHRGWIAVTKDKNIRYRTAEIASIKRNGRPGCPGKEHQWCRDWQSPRAVRHESAALRLPAQGTSGVRNRSQRPTE